MEDSIFDEAAKQPKSRPIRSAGDKPLASGASGKKKQNPGNATGGDDDPWTMLKRIREIRTSLEAQLESVYESGKENKIDMEKYFGSTYKLTKEQIETIQQQEKILVDKINAITPSDSCIRPVPKSKEKMTQERKGKFRGARQNWIPIR